MANFDDAVMFVIGNEGKFSDNPNDRGGATNYGISLRFLSTFSADELKLFGIFEIPTIETIRNMTIEQAKKIYYQVFWCHAPFQDIKNQEYANYIFDMVVNIGIAPAIKCVQRACWAVMKRWKDLPDDGILGKNTLKAIQQCGFMVMPALRAERANHYRNIVQSDASQKVFLDGWYNRTYCN